VSKVRVAAFSVSLDGYGAGPRQDLEHPLGVRGIALHDWLFKTASFGEMHGEGGGSRGVDNDFAVESFRNVGAWIIGRNMFGPVRGAWDGDSWKGWWGDEPPYHVPVFVLTHHARAPLVMSGGTTFHFVTDGPAVALEQAKAAAAGKDVRVGGGVATIHQYLNAGAIDEMHLAFSPVVLGEGESLFAGIDLARLGFQVAKTTPGEGALHASLKRF
jgi:dihydrofolate reductase